MHDVLNTGQLKKNVLFQFSNTLTFFMSWAGPTGVASVLHAAVKDKIARVLSQKQQEFKNFLATELTC